ncbi:MULTISPECIES: phosphatase domain-containing protein [unclassified Arcicella]|uniref:App1 family protein n=1 Tax=unclassified Arcicella TaxID=2644986 RepID=UPI002856CD57|nr:MULTISPECIES: phosphatase domain-containing protein [unclassified Arcicella]MDR6562352.1 phosphatidate phosphatase APP1 [Arcicella sp. BE51]MDR6812246.1 phosphatidate phosphatase APP1 [Arcicella sp. BE140]MDR6823577.1 phosphatidate phosphatase APP1 [Arcicella sp. BE139]
MSKKSYQQNATVKVYHGYGHQDNLIVYGHVLAGKPPRAVVENNLISNVMHLIKIFSVKPIAGVSVRLQWNNQYYYSKTAQDGFFKFEWKSTSKISAGWHAVFIDLVGPQDKVLTTGEGKIFVPEATQYGFISDIDDTVLVSHSAKTGKKLRVMFTKNPLSRKTFADVVKFYRLLSLAHTEPALLNPFFYVSSSEWNLYDDLNVFFKHNQLPKGVFLLNEIKRWYQLLKTGATKHQGKLMRVVRLFEAFPKQRFILLGDNSQKDPAIYAAIANKYPEKVVAIYIRNVSPKKEEITLSLMKSITNKNIQTCQFEHTDEAISHARDIGLIV